MQVTKSGATDLYRRLLARYPALQAGAYRELNFLTQCQTDAAALLSYRQAHPHCDKPLANGSADPACHGCSPLGYAALFNTSEVRARLGACDQPLGTQSLCAGGALLPDKDARRAPATGYKPVFTVDASSSYSGSGGLAQRAAAQLASLSPRTKVILLLRSPVDVGRAVYNAKLAAECGSHECDGAAGGQVIPPYERVIERELAFLNTTAGAAALQTLVAAASVSAARDAEQALLSAWESYATKKKYEPTLWGRAMYSLHGLYTPALLAWAEKFAQPGRPMLVVQSEAYFADAPGLVDDLFGEFLFGDAEGLARFADTGAGAEAPTLRRYGAKAAQSAAQRCALYELLRGPNKALEKLLTKYQKDGRVQLRRAAQTGPLWGRPAECGWDPDAPAAPQSADYLDYTGMDQESYAPECVPPCPVPTRSALTTDVRGGRRRRATRSYDYACVGVALTALCRASADDARACAARRYTFVQGDYAPTPSGR